jgi:hypothetical protein
VSDPSNSLPRYDALVVEWIVGSERHTFVVEPGCHLTIGRDRGNDVVLDPDDRGLSRRAARIGESAGRWWFHNESETRGIEVREPSGLSAPLGTRAHRAIERDGTTFVLSGRLRRHGLRVDAADGSWTRSVEGDDPEATMAMPRPSAVERLALVALGEGFLEEFPRWDPTTRSYADAGRRLGLPSSTVRKRVEAFRMRVHDAGFGGMEAPDARDRVVELAVATQSITRDDLSLLPERRRRD